MPMIGGRSRQYSIQTLERDSIVVYLFSVPKQKIKCIKYYNKLHGIICIVLIIKRSHNILSIYI